MKPPKAPCLGCKDRVADPNCHTTCEKYISFREAKTAENEKIHHDKKLEMEANSIEAERIIAISTGKIRRSRKR